MRGVVAVFCALCLGVCVGALSQQKEADEGDECRGYCSSTYPEHTYPNVSADGREVALARSCRGSCGVVAASYPQLLPT